MSGSMKCGMRINVQCEKCGTFFRVHATGDDLTRRLCKKCKGKRWHG